MPPPPPPGCFKCSKNCDLCKNSFIQSTTFTSFVTGKTYKVKQHLTCNSEAVIYLAFCNKCKLQYVGSTANAVKLRFRNHKSHIKKYKRTCQVAIHFNETPHDFLDFKFMCIIEGITRADNNLESTLIKREAYWTGQLFTFVPHGLNKRCEFKSKNRIHYN